jgi:predicted GIY-YIG superfamily endonuclease
MKYVMNYRDYLLHQYLIENSRTLKGIDENNSYSLADDFINDSILFKKRILHYVKRHSKRLICSHWYIGITNNLEATTNRHKNNFGITYDLKHFKSWKCKSVKQAGDLEHYFIKEYGFSGSEGGSTSNTNNIYVFHKGRK